MNEQKFYCLDGIAPYSNIPCPAFKVGGKDQNIRPYRHRPSRRILRVQGLKTGKFRLTTKPERK